MDYSNYENSSESISGSESFDESGEEDMDTEDNFIETMCEEDNTEEFEEDDDMESVSSQESVQLLDEEELFSTTDQSEILVGFEEEEQPDSGLIYAEYQEECINEGIKHPASLSEGAGLANVTLPPITHKLRLKWKNEKVKLSKAQLLAVIYATQAHQCLFRIRGTLYRKGFLLGDGTGVGKTLTLAAMGIEAMHGDVDQVLWIVPNKELITAAIAEVGRLSKVKCWELAKLHKEDAREHGFFFATYSYITKEKNMKMLRTFLGKRYQGMMILDECHYIKSAYSKKKKSVAGGVIMEIQLKHTMCRVVYSSATSASEPHHLICFQRLQFWGDGAKWEDDDQFFNEMKSMGVAGLELLSMDMKRRGVFLSRVISFKDVEILPLNIELEDDFLELYSKSCELFTLLLAKMEKDLETKSPVERRTMRSSFHADMLRYFASLMLTAKIRGVGNEIVKQFNKDRSIVITVQHTGEAGFKRDCSGKPYSILEQILRRVYRILGIEIGPGKIYVSNKAKRVGLEDAMIEERMETDEVECDDDDDELFLVDDEDEMFPHVDDEDEDFLEERKKPLGHGKVPASKHIVRFSCNPSLFLKSARQIGAAARATKHFSEKTQRNFLLYSLAVVEYIDEYFEGRNMSPEDLSWSSEECSESLDDDECFARLFHEIRPFLPINPLEELTDRLSKRLNEEVVSLIANGTGRQYFYCKDNDTDIWECIRTKSRDQEINDFMDNKKRIILISDASSVGVSLHADKGRENKRRRVHVILEYPWSPDKLVQTLGRTLRANSVTTPIYVLVKTDIPSEARFICVIEERMKQLGAICQGQSQASLLSSHMATNLNTPSAVNALKRTICSFMRDRKTADLLLLIGIVNETKKRYSPADVMKFVSRIFNRLMMLPIPAQKYFFGKLNVEIGKIAQGDGVFSDISGIDIPSAKFDADVWQVAKDEWSFRAGSVQLLTLKIDRVLTFEMLKPFMKKGVGYYSTRQGEICYVLEEGKKSTDPKNVLFPYSREIITTALGTRFTKATKNELAKFRWNCQVETLLKNPGCICQTKRTKCRQGICGRGWGTQIIYVVCGFAYNIYDILERCSQVAGSMLRLARVRWTDKYMNEYRDVGLLLESDALELIKPELDRKLNVERAKQ